MAPLLIVFPVRRSINVWASWACSGLFVQFLPRSEHNTRTSVSVLPLFSLRRNGRGRNRPLTRPLKRQGFLKLRHNGSAFW